MRGVSPGKVPLARRQDHDVLAGPANGDGPGQEQPEIWLGVSEEGHRGVVGTRRSVRSIARPAIRDPFVVLDALEVTRELPVSDRVVVEDALLLAGRVQQVLE